MEDSQSQKEEDSPKVIFMDITLQTLIDSGFAPVGPKAYNRVCISEDPIGFEAGDYNLC